MHWRLDDLLDLPVEVYEVLVEQITEELKKQRQASGEEPAEEWPPDS